MKKRVVEQQDVDVVKSTRDYEAFRRGSNGPESTLANPDSLTEEQGFFHVSSNSKETQERVQKLLKIAKQVLTEQQYIVFDLVALQCMTIRRAARVIKRSPGRVDQLWTTARHKLQKAYEERT